MEPKHSSITPIFATAIITALVVGAGVYIYKDNQANSRTDKPQNTATQNSNIQESTLLQSKKSFLEYFQNRQAFSNNSMTKKPSELGLSELATLSVSCPENADGPCGFDLLILAKEPVQSNQMQEFYLAQPGGAGYSYFGPFEDNLENILSEAAEVDSLTESN